MSAQKVCGHEPLSKHKFQVALAAAWGRVWPQIGKGVMAQRMGLDDPAPIERGAAGTNLPSAHTVFNSLLADPTALDEVLAQYGVRLVPCHPEAANDLATVAGVVNAMGDLAGRMADGIRCHNDTLAIAALLRPHMPALAKIVAEADQLRGVAA